MRIPKTKEDKGDGRKKKWLGDQKEKKKAYTSSKNGAYRQRILDHWETMEQEGQRSDVMSRISHSDLNQSAKLLLEELKNL